MEAPHNLSAEAGVLGGILFDNANYNRVRDTLRPEMFYALENQTVYEVVSETIRNGGTADGVTLTDKLDYAYLSQLLEASVFGPELVDYASIVADCWKRRQLVEMGVTLQQRAMRENGDAILSDHERSLDELQKTSGSAIELHDMGQALELALANRDQRAGRFVPTGLPSLDRKLGGLMLGAVHVLAARPSMGKTTLATVIGEHMARERTVAFFSLEMPKESLAVRRACYDAWRRGKSIRYFDVEQGHARPDELEFLEGSKTCPRFMVDDRMGLCPMQIASALRQMNSRARRLGLPPVSVVFVDHIGHVKPDEGRRNRYEDTGNVSKALLEIAKRFNVAVVEMVQLNRASQAEKRRPQLHDLRNSGEIEEDAHTVMFLHREDYYLERQLNDGDEDDQISLTRKLNECKGKAEVIIAKNRNGPVGTETFTHLIESNVIRERGPVVREEAA